MTKKTPSFFRCKHIATTHCTWQQDDIYTHTHIHSRAPLTNPVAHTHSLKHLACMCWCVSFNHTTSSLASWQHVSHFIVLLSVAVAVCHLHVYVTSSQTIFLPLPQSSLHAALLLMLPLRLRPVTVVHCSHSLLLLLLLLELL